MTEPPYRRIAADIAGRIARGDLAAGDRVPSTRQIVSRYGVAMATATKVLAELRRMGLVRAAPGVGTVVVAPARRSRRPVVPEPQRDVVVRTAVEIADMEGLGGLSMRRLAAELGSATMSLYRHIADKEELLLLMMDRVFAANPPPDPAPDGWRARVEAICRRQWAMYRRHPWLAQAVSFTRPLPAPHAMAHTEWTMQSLDGHGLDQETLFVAAVTMANYVRGTAVSLEAEAQARHETGITETQWMETQQARLQAAVADGRMPIMREYVTGTEHEFSLDLLLEFGLQRLLDGLELQIAATSG
ncbi:TetR/AcrR family transcriptional regulator C-terminal domain-containing protein [Jidongwangia harbinensis]|uniref:TetR/AcrR family transcriptional regulator C-terminal domain-containing protein n=1 Tax=Jidongwangia harbinensis TaxID=2878561 RepID=UPI001CDA2CA9|nr:TetR/AcrR family transcriptional regulator C-terminal domain-containing protein [Jidongwangia harbinensis]MCA2219370.1 TetR/AcrR family transcriptional regulator C-terminal domain-containing protein [Jidongwangia harbinensis]